MSTERSILRSSSNIIIDGLIFIRIDNMYYVNVTTLRQRLANVLNNNTLFDITNISVKKDNITFACVSFLISILSSAIIKDTKYIKDNNKRDRIKNVIETLSRMTATPSEEATLLHKISGKCIEEQSLAKKQEIDTIISTDLWPINPTDFVKDEIELACKIHECARSELYTYYYKRVILFDHIDSYLFLSLVIIVLFDTILISRTLEMYTDATRFAIIALLNDNLENYYADKCYKLVKLSHDGIKVIRLICTYAELQHAKIKPILTIGLWLNTWKIDNILAYVLRSNTVSQDKIVSHEALRHFIKIGMNAKNINVTCCLSNFTYTVHTDQEIYDVELDCTWIIERECVLYIGKPQIYCDKADRVTKVDLMYKPLDSIYEYLLREIRLEHQDRCVTTRDEVSASHTESAIDAATKRLNNDEVVLIRPLKRPFKLFGKIIS